MIRWEKLDSVERAVLKNLSETSFLAFIRFFFQLCQGQKFLVNWHHIHECNLAERVYKGYLNRLIVNVSPGSTKTEIWSIHFPAWAIALNSRFKRPTRFFPMSYSDSLVTANSARVKDIILSEPYQYMWPMELSQDTRAKHNWEFLDENGNPHSMYGTSISGQVIGRRAGYMVDGFTGALIIDDPMPTKDEFSGVMMDRGTKMLNTVVRSRLAQDSVPIVMIQQRIAKGDSTDFLLGPKSPDEYELFKIPALIDREYVDTLEPDVRALLERDTGFEGKKVSYWQAKEPYETLLNLQSADAYMFSCQYQQDPDMKLAEGVIYRQQVAQMVDSGRYLHIPIEHSLPMQTYWDLGIGDYMVLWLVQRHGREIRIVGCYGNSNEGIEHYINWLHDYRDNHGIRFSAHYAPHDIEVRELSSKRTRKAIALSMGIRFKTVPRPKTKAEGIQALKSIFPRLWISTACDEKDPTGHSGWEALKTLRRPWDVVNEVFTDEIIPKWATNYTDALQQLALAEKDEVKPAHDQFQQTAGGWMSR